MVGSGKLTQVLSTTHQTIQTLFLSPLSWYSMCPPVQKRPPNTHPRQSVPSIVPPTSVRTFFGGAPLFDNMQVTIFPPPNHIKLRVAAGREAYTTFCHRESTR